MALVTTPSSPTADSYVSVQDFLNFELQRFGKRITLDTSAPTLPTGSETIEDEYTLPAAAAQVLTAGADGARVEGFFNTFAGPQVGETGAVRTPQGIRISETGLYSFRARINATLLPASDDGRWGFFLRRYNGQTGGSEVIHQQVEPQPLIFTSPTAAEPYQTDPTDLALEETTFNSGDFLQAGIYYMGSATGDALHYSIDAGSTLELVHYDQTREQGVLNADTEVQIEADLRLAATYEDVLFKWILAKADADQARAFPRTGFTTIPEAVKQAQMFLANQERENRGSLLAGNFKAYAQTQTTENVESASYAGASVRMQKTTINTDQSHLQNNQSQLAGSHAFLQNLLSEWIDSTGAAAPGGTVQGVWSR